jgi:hypothetical protein
MGHIQTHAAQQIRWCVAQRNGGGHISNVTILDEITSDAVLGAAYEWRERNHQKWRLGPDPVF